MKNGTFAERSLEECQAAARKAHASNGTPGRRRIPFRQDPIWRESEIQIREKRTPRLICVAEQPTSIWFRLKGTKSVIELPISRAYQIAAQLAGDAMRRQRRERRKRGAL